MQNKFIFNLCLIALCLSSAATYAATNASLWGGTSDIDKPIPPIEQIEQQQQQVQAQQEAIANEKNICDIFTAQTTLSSDTANSAKIRDALGQAYKAAMPDYKMFMVSPDAANDLYIKYRDMYMKTYCLATTK